jgi:hypothetical protein
MFAQANHLVIQSPSSTTVSYTVSNALPDSTSSSRILSYVSSGLRVLLCLYMLLVDLQITGALLGNGSKNRWLDVKGLEFLDFPIRVVPGLLDWRLIVLLSVLTVFLCLRRGYTGKACLTGERDYIRLPVFRGIIARPQGYRHPDIYKLAILLFHFNYHLHTYYPDPGHSHLRGVHRSRGSLLSCCDC